MRAALLLVDLQSDYLTTSGLEPPAAALVARTAALLRDCRRLRLPVIHVWTTVHPDDDRRLPHWREADRWMCVAGTAGHQPPETLRPLEGEPVVNKTGFNPFASGELDAALRGCDTVIVAGLHLHACVRTAAVECLERGYTVWIASDAVASNDPLYAESTWRWLSARSVRFVPGASILAWIEGGAPPAVVHRSPRRLSEVLFEVPVAGAAEVSAAAAAARECWTVWRKTAPAARLAILAALAEGLDRAAPQLAAQMAVEIGKPLSHGLEETRRAAANVRDVIRRAAEFQFTERESGGTVRHRPWGVVALISPWNNPVAIPVGKIAPALAYGNAVVWKPAPAAHGISLEVLELLRQAGVPSDAVRVVPGDGSTARRLLGSGDLRAARGTLAGGAQRQQRGHCLGRCRFRAGRRAGNLGRFRFCRPALYGESSGHCPLAAFRSSSRGVEDRRGTPGLGRSARRRHGYRPCD
jgi:nicotinamidase-related amidase